MVVASLIVAGCLQKVGAHLTFENRTGEELHLTTNISPYRETVVKAHDSATFRLPMENSGPSDYLVKDKNGKLLGKLTARYISQFYDARTDTYCVPIKWN